MHAGLAWHLERAATRYGAAMPIRLQAGLSRLQNPPQDAAKKDFTSHPAKPGPRPPAPRRPVTTAARETPAVEAEVELETLTAGSLEDLATQVAGCTRCKLHEQRRNLVFGEGAADADLMFVGEAPGAREDALGRPFVGASGQLLTKIIENAVGLPREAVYIANVNKCRPPGNRDPEPDEVRACTPILRGQITLIRPRVIVALGRVAAANLLGRADSVTRLRRSTDLEAHGVPVIVTWHPAYLLRNPSAKRETWDDIKRVNRLLGRPEVPGAG